MPSAKRLLPHWADGSHRKHFPAVLRDGRVATVHAVLGAGDAERKTLGAALRA